MTYTLPQEVLVPGGIIALDDYMGPHWPGVTRILSLYVFRKSAFEAVYVLPEQIISDHDFGTRLVSAAVCTAIEAICNDEVRSGRWKDVEFAGSNCLSFQ